MNGRKYVAFLALTLLSLLVASSLLGPALIVAPPNTTPLEDILSPELPAGNNTNETGPPVEAPHWEGIMLNVTGASHIHYLRTRVYSVYVNGEWREGNVTRIPTSVIAPPEVTVPHHSERDTVSVVSSGPLAYLPTALHTVRVEAPGITAIPEYNLFESASSVTSYRFTAVTNTFNIPYLLNLTAGNLTDYLNAPGDEALKNLAERITVGADSDYERALRIMEYLNGNYRLNENATPPEGTDRLHWFLFQSGEGSSYDFATAFAVLARLNGLPARLVEGFYVNATPEEQTVTGKNHLYWAEVYFNGAGWLTFDPIHNYRNTFRPFDLRVERYEVNLEPNESTAVRVHFWDVASGLNATLRVVDWRGREVFRTNESGTFDVRIGPFERPGSYVLFVNASAGDGSTFMQPIRVNVRGNVSVLPEVNWVSVRHGSGTRVLLTAEGFSSVEISSDPPLTEVVYLKRTSNLSWIILTEINAVPPAGIGWRALKLRVHDNSTSYTVILPVFIYDFAGISATLPSRVLAGSRVTISGTVEGRHSGCPVKSGYVFAGITAGRFILLGVGNVSDGRFSFNATLPRYLPGGLSSIDLVYVPPTGNPMMPGTFPAIVRIIGLSELKVPETVLAGPGNVTLTGALLRADGNPIPNATVEYLIDGVGAGKVNTSEDGTFRVTVPVKGIEAHRLEFFYNGSEDYVGSSASTLLRTAVLEVPGEVNVTLGRPFTLSGELIGVENTTLKAYIFPDREYTVDVSNGSFSLTVEPFARVGERTLEFRSGAYILGRVVLRVTSPVEVKLLTDKAEGEERAEIRVAALNALGEPLAGARLKVKVGNLTRVVTTNASGIAVLEVPVPKKSVNTTVTVAFDGAGYYLPAKETFYVVVSRKRKIPWLYIGVAVLIGAVLVRYALVHRRPRETEEGGVLKIIFTSGVPVYREGEGIGVSVECDGIAELIVDGKPVGRGREFTLVLPAGEHSVEARCGEKVERTSLRVVKEYDEAVVDYYERCFLPWARKMGLEVDGMTPREIAAELTGMMYPWEPLDALTEIFERAKYSTVALSRREFLRFYRSLLELVGGECVA